MTLLLSGEKDLVTFTNLRLIETGIRPAFLDCRKPIDFSNFEVNATSINFPQYKVECADKVKTGLDLTFYYPIGRLPPPFLDDMKNDHIRSSSDLSRYDERIGNYLGYIDPHKLDKSVDRYVINWSMNFGNKHIQIWSEIIRLDTMIIKALEKCRANENLYADINFKVGRSMSLDVVI